MRLRFRFSAKSYVHSGSTNPLMYRTVGQHLQHITEKYPENQAVVSHHQNKVFTYSEFYRKAYELAASFIALGLEKHDRIGIYSPNNYEWVLTQFAASMADLILVNINPAYQLKELHFALNKVECKALITHPQFKSSNYIWMIKELAPEISSSTNGQLHSKQLPHLRNVIRIDNAKEQGFLNFHELFGMTDASHTKKLDHRMELIKPDDITNIQFTSGTTGSPKGAALTHFNIVNNGRYIGERTRYTPQDKVCIAVPLYHCFGMVLGNMACISYGSSMVFPSEGFNAQAALETVTKYKCTSLYGVPTMFIEYLKEYRKNPGSYEISSLRTGIIAGSLAPELLMKDIIEVLNLREITNCYGMTETSPVSTQTKIEDSFSQRTSTVGSVSPHLEIKIIDEEGHIVPVGTPGEYCVRGYSLMKKYWNDPEQTRATLDSDGFLKTGDIAIMDRDGYISIAGRKKDMIIRGGENVYPKEIEDFLLAMPGVEMVQVVGCNDAKFGEEIAALIKMKPNTVPFDKMKVYNYCHKQIAHFKVPKYVKFVDEFPFTVTGKPQKFKMREDINKDLQDPKLRELYQIR